jgi:hypothetical protein
MEPAFGGDTIMRKLLLATVALFSLSTASHATIFTITTPDPTSATGNFSLSPGAGPFDDQVTFTLTRASTFTIANATNTFAGPGDEIGNWQASIWDSVDGIVGNGNDALLFGPQSAGACFLVPNCQTVGGSGTINNAGLFYADFTGVGSGTSGYSGNISTFAVPGPIVGAGLPGLLAMFGFGVLALRRRFV